MKKERKKKNKKEMKEREEKKERHKKSIFQFDKKFFHKKRKINPIPTK